MKNEKSILYDLLEDRGAVVRPMEGRTLETSGMSVTFKVTSEMTNDQLGVYEITLAPKTVGAKLHYHRFMDETFIVTKGRVTLNIGKREHEAEAGSVAYVPRFTPHAFRNDSEVEAKLMLIFNPGQRREGFFVGLHEILEDRPVNFNKFLELYNKYDSFPVDKTNSVQF